MYLRIVRGTVQAGQLDEFARRWETNVGAQLKQTPGFRHAYSTGNRQTNALVGVTIWETLPDAETTNRIMQSFRPLVADITAGPPTIEDYEVLVEL
jgi:heme-degrading monooxygenase HmoA